MNRMGRVLLPLLTVLSMLSLCVGTSSALTSRYIRVANVAAAPGVCSITIESFGLLASKEPVTNSILSYTANIPIPNGSTPTNSAILIRNGLNSALPFGYLAVIPAGTPTLVQVSRGTGTFTMTIVADVPIQTYLEETIVPALGDGGLVALPLSLCAVAFLVLARRRRSNRIS